MCVTNHHDMTLAVKVALNPNTTNQWVINSVPNDRFLDWSKLKADADNKSDVAEKLKFVFGKVENIVPAFSPFPTMFLKGFSVGVI